MVTAEQLVDKFFEKAQIHKPSMTAHQLHAYVIGLLADELAWAFNNDVIVAKNVKQLLHRLDPRKTTIHKSMPKSNEGSVHNSQLPNSQSGNSQSIPKVETSPSSTSISAVNSKVGADISKTLSYQSLTLFLQKFPKTVIKDLRDQKNGFLWIFVTAKAYEDDSPLFQWLRKNKFEYSEIEKAWYYPIL